MRVLPLFLAAGFLTAAAPAPGTVRLNWLELDYDPAAWTVTSTLPDRWRAEPSERGGQTVEIRADYGGPCSQEAMAALAESPRRDRNAWGTTTLPSGLTLHWARGYTGCRNAAADPIAACATHMGAVHLFTAASSCRHSAYARPGPMDLLQGLRRR